VLGMEEKVELESIQRAADFAAAVRFGPAIDLADPFRSGHEADDVRSGNFACRDLLAAPAVWPHNDGIGANVTRGIKACVTRIADWKYRSVSKRAWL